MTKVPINITVDKEVVEEFKELCENNDMKMSTKINSLMREWIQRNHE